MTQNLIDNLMITTQNRIVYSDTNKLRNLFKRAIAENRFTYLYQNNQTIGYLIYVLFDKNGYKECLKNEQNFHLPIHTKDGEYLYIVHCVTFDSRKNNFLYLRKFFRQSFPQIKYVFWHRFISNKDKKVIFYTVNGGNR